MMRVVVIIIIVSQFLSTCPFCPHFPHIRGFEHPSPGARVCYTGGTVLRRIRVSPHILFAYVLIVAPAAVVVVLVVGTRLEYLDGFDIARKNLQCVRGGRLLF